MKKILIIGSKGMAGHVIYHYFKENTNYTIIDIARDSGFHVPTYELDITDFNSLKLILQEETPTHVINCIGMLNQEAESHPDKAVLLNSYLPHFLARTGIEIGFKLTHISTDCVFNGKTGSYLEDSYKDGFGFYAQSKSLGEVVNERHLTLRTSIIGPELKCNGIGLFDWFTKQQGRVVGYSMAFWTGVTTLELAKAIHASIEQDLKGLYHLVNNEKITKLELLKLFQIEFKNSLIKNILSDESYKIDKSLVNTRTDFSFTIPKYSEMVIEMRKWILNHPDLYRNYKSILY